MNPTDTNRHSGTLPILVAVQKRIEQDGRCLLVLDGDCGAGKTTIADEIGSFYQATVIRMDSFFLPLKLRTQERFQEPGGNVHYERFLSDVLANLARECDFSYHHFDCHNNRLCLYNAPFSPLMIIEGSYSHHPAFQAAYSSLHALRVWVSVTEEEQARRLKARNPQLFPRFVTEWIPLEKAYQRVYHVKSKAEIRVESEAGHVE